MPDSKNISSYKRYLLKRSIDALKNKRGFHTALISLFIPAKRKMFDVIGYLKNEIGESSNIKSKANRKNVLDSISALISRLRLIKNVPENGLILYSGQIPRNNAPGTERQEIYIIEPPEPVTSFKYYCAAEFLIKPLLYMVEEKGAFGIINIENKEAAVGWVRGSHLEVCKTFTSGVHSKHKAGGQSQRRLERLIEEGAQQFYIRVGEYANLIFLEVEDLEGIYVSGAGMSKEKFVNKGVLDYRLKDKVLGFVDVSYSGEAGIRETVIKIQDKLKDLGYIKEKKIYNRFLTEIVKDTGKATYGEKQVRKALMGGAVQTLLISEKMNKVRVDIECSNCDYTLHKTTDPDKLFLIQREMRGMACPECNSKKISIVKETEVIEDLGSIARDQGTQIEIMSTETEGGSALFLTFGGIGAILRFAM